MDAANVIFRTAKRRCYISSPKTLKKQARKEPELDPVDDEDAWAAWDEAEAGFDINTGKQSMVKDSQPQAKARPKKRKMWIPEGMEPVLEELPKWGLLAQVLKEIEEEIIRAQSFTSFRE